MLRCGDIAAFGVEIADSRCEVERRRTFQLFEIDGQRLVSSSACSVHLAKADHRLRIVRKHECGSTIFANRVVELFQLQIQLTDLRGVPRLCLRILNRRRLLRHLHRL